MPAPISNLHFDYMNTSERRVLDLGSVGFPSVPVLGYCNYRNPRPDVPEHWHPGCLEIHYCVRNTLTFGFNGRSHALRPGEVFVNFPDEHHTVSEHPRGLILYWLILRTDPSDAPFLQQPPKEADAFRQALLHIPHRHFRGTDAIKTAFRSLHLLYDEPASHLRTLRLRTTLIELLLNLLSASKAYSVPTDESHLEAVFHQLRSFPEKPYRLDDLARQANMGTSHFVRRFRDFSGLPPYQFLLKCRIQTAQNLLKATADPITDMALRLGFCSSQHFANIFKRHTGMTPLAYRQGCPGPQRCSDSDDGQTPSGA